MRRAIETLLIGGGATVLLICLAAIVWRDRHADELVDGFERQALVHFERSIETRQGTPNTATADQQGADTRTPVTAGVARGIASRSTDAVLQGRQDKAGDSTSAPLQVNWTADQSDWSKTRISSFRNADAAEARVIGVFRAPAIRVEAPVLRGIDDVALDSGLGWLDRTAFPGELGNTAIAGHRDSFFRRLGQLEVGDVVTLRTLQGTLSYRVTGYRIVEPDDVSVLESVAGESMLTLITCYPFRYLGNAPQRYIVHAELIGTA